MMDIEFKVGTAALSQVHQHFIRCDHQYQPPLSCRVDLEKYAQKVSEKGVLLEAWKGGQLIGLVAVYLNSGKNSPGFITDVSVESAHAGQGIASSLLRMCVNEAQARGVRALTLEVSEGNAAAIHLYSKFGFQEQSRGKGTLTFSLSIESEGEP